MNQLVGFEKYSDRLVSSKLLCAGELINMSQESAEEILSNYKKMMADCQQIASKIQEVTHISVCWGDCNKRICSSPWKEMSTNWL